MKWTLSIWRTTKCSGRQEILLESRKKNKEATTEPSVGLVFGDWLTGSHRRIKVAYISGRWCGPLGRSCSFLGQDIYFKTVVEKQCGTVNSRDAAAGQRQRERALYFSRWGKWFTTVRNLIKILEVHAISYINDKSRFRLLCDNQTKMATCSSIRKISTHFWIPKWLFPLPPSPTNILLTLCLWMELEGGGGWK